MEADPRDQLLVYEAVNSATRDASIWEGGAKKGGRQGQGCLLDFFSSQA